MLHGFSFFRLDLVDCLHQCFNIQVGVDTFGERHGTGVSHNLLDHGLVYMGFCQHGDAGVPGTVRRLVISKLLHQGCEVTVVVVPVIKVLLIRRVEQIFTLRTFVPRFVEWQHLVGNVNFPQVVLGFAGDHIKVLFFQMYLNYINNEVNKKSRSLLDVLKHGVEFDNGVSLTLMYRKPATTFNQKAEALYQQNVLSVMEEVWHKDGERIELVIFLNGIAIFTFELKCNTSGQNYEDTIRQYKFERDYNTRLLKFKAGCLAHFAMDLNEGYMCTNLKGKSSFFLPFNKGCGVGIHSGKVSLDGHEYFLCPFYTETILNETITPSDIRAVEAQVDQYNFLDIDDIEEFNGYLYQDKRTSK